MPPASQMPGRPNIPARPPATADASGGKSKLVKILVGSTAFVACAVGGYFGFQLVGDWQNKANEKRHEIEKRSDGGEMGHIANLYDFLDATEPGGRGLGGGKRGSGPGQRSAGAAHPIHVAGEEDDMDSPEKKLPLAPAVYTLDLGSVTLSDGRANGMVSGTNFVVDEAYVELSGNSQVLRLIHHPPYNPDRELLIYIQLKSGGTLAGHSFSVAKDAKGTEIVQVTKRGTAKPGMAPEVKSYNTGFALKLEVGQGKDGEIPAKLFVALPDKEQSVVAGSVTIRPPPKMIHFRDDF
jgi:hypothetical protein